MGGPLSALVSLRFLLLGYRLKDFGHSVEPILSLRPRQIPKSSGAPSRAEQGYEADDEEDVAPQGVGYSSDVLYHVPQPPIEPSNITTDFEDESDEDILEDDSEGGDIDYDSEDGQETKKYLELQDLAEP
jgi:hypothetical protein